jgi:hypothetical protein
VDGNHIQGWSATVTNITGTACGLVQVPQLTATVQPANLVINSSQAIIHLFIAGTTFLIQGLTLTLTAVQPLSATVTGVNTDGSVRATAHGVLQAVITGQVPELTCKVTLPAGVTTGTSTKVPLGRSTPTNVPDPWTVTGAAVHGPIIGATGTVVGNDFRVPALPQSKKPTGFNCNLGAVFNEILSGYNKHNVAYRAPFPVTTAPTPAGEVQASAGLTVTSIDLPSVKPCDPGPGLCISAGSP